MLLTPLERWRGRAWRAFAAAGCLIVAFHFAWGWHADRALSRWEADARRRGLPLAVSESLVPDPDDDSVAFGREVRAIRAISSSVAPPTESQKTRPYVWGSMCRPQLDLSRWNLPDRLPLPGTWMAAADASERANTVAFELARQARISPDTLGRRIQCGSKVDLKFDDARLRYALALRDSAELNHLLGRDVQAVERLLDLAHAARVLRQDADSYTQIFSDKALQLVADSALFIASGLEPNSASAPSFRTSMRSLIAAMLRPEPWTPETVAALRARYRDFAECAIERRPNMQHFDVPDIADSRLLRPVFRTLELRMLRRYDAIEPALSLDNWPAVRAMPFVDQVEWPNRDDNIARLRDGLAHSLYMTAQCRAAAISLAARLYFVDQGHWPDTLSELVPAYLPSVPRDPCTADARAMGYIVLKGQRPGGGDRPLVYFGERHAEFRGGIPTDLPQSPGPLLPRNTDFSKGAHAWFDLSRFTTGSPAKR